MAGSCCPEPGPNTNLSTALRGSEEVREGILELRARLSELKSWACKRV